MNFFVFFSGKVLNFVQAIIYFFAGFGSVLTIVPARMLNYFRINFIIFDL